MSAPETSPSPAVDEAAGAPRDRRLLWLVVANLVVALLVGALVSQVLADSRRLHRQRALDAVDTLAQSVAQNVAAEIAGVDLALRQLRIAADGGDPVRIDETARDLSRLVPSVERLRTVPLSMLPAGLRPDAASGDRDRLIVAGPRETGDGRWVLDMARPPSAIGPGADVAMVAEYDVSRFERLFAGLELGGHNAVSLRMQDLALVARYSGSMRARSDLGTRSTSPQLVAALQASPVAGTYVAPTALDGVERANAYRRVIGAPMVVVVGLAVDDFLMTWRQEARNAVGLALLAVAVVAGASAFAYRAWRRDDGRRLLLETERARLRGLLVTINDGLHVLDRTGRLVEFSDAFAKMLGVERDELIGAHVMRWERRYSPAQVDKVLRTFAVGQRLDFESRFERADGRIVDVAIRATGVRIDRRDLLILSARDVGDEKRAMRRLRDSEALLERTGRIAGVGGWELVPSTATLELTAQARRLLDLAPRASVGLRACLRRLPADHRRVLMRGIEATARHGVLLDVEVPATSASGRSIWLHCTAERIEGPGGAPRVAGAIRDVTERHAHSVELRQEQELRVELQRQAAAQQQMLVEREAMLDVLAHEVRQPLNNASAAMQSALATLRDIDEQAAATRLVRAQAVLGQVMARLDNTLAVAMMLARQGPVEREDTDLDTLLAVAIADMPAADRPRVVIRRETAARTVSIDMSLMRLALRNLLSNALKYSRPGSEVTLRVADSEHPLGLVIDVIDRGNGIEPGLRDHLFERGARGRHTPGAEHGLGLYIVRRVMEMHGGLAGMQATGEQGTTMRLLVAEEADDE